MYRMIKETSKKKRENGERRRVRGKSWDIL